MTDSQHSILGLPLELRQLIYKEVLSRSLSGPHLLLTCREIYAEARRFLFQRPIRFKSQAALYKWLEQASHDLLRYVEEIALELRDVDLTPLLASTGSLVSQPNTNISPLHTWDVYERELQNFNRALRNLPNVKIFTIQALLGRQPHLYHDFLEKVLSSLSSIYPGLLDLSLRGNFHHQSLVFLKSFQALKAFSFDGFSASEAEKTAEILSSLKLTSISLVSEHAMLKPAQQYHSVFTSKPPSFDGQVLRTLNHIASFSITERSLNASSPRLFFTPNILESLHSQTLSNLSVILSHAPESDTLEALEEFLEKNDMIESLELDWPNMDAGLLGRYALLTDTLRSIWIRSEDMGTAFDILLHIIELREGGNALELKKVVLVRSERAETGGVFLHDQGGLEEIDSTMDESDHVNVARAKHCLYCLGVRVAWRTEVA